MLTDSEMQYDIACIAICERFSNGCFCGYHEEDTRDMTAEEYEQVQRLYHGSQE